MRKRLLLVVFLLTVLSLFPTARTQGEPTAAFTVIVPSPIIYNVPFSIQVQVNSGTTDFIDYDVHMGSESHRVDFSQTSLQRTDTGFGQLSALSGSQENGRFYRVRIETNGKVLQGTKTLFTLNNLVVRSKTNTEQVQVKFNPAPTITPAQSGLSFAITSADSGYVPLQVSRCQDGVVGYLDSDENGVQDSDEVSESCDHASPGCVECKYVDIGYKANNCGSGSRNCQVTAMGARELLKAEFAALLDGQCYPVGHPNPLFCDQGQFMINYASFTSQEKIKFLSQVGTILRSFFTKSDKSS